MYGLQEGENMLRVLVVDDDAGLRLSVASALNHTRRFHVEEAIDGLDAVAQVKRGQFDLVILDVDMPNLSGLEALRAIKEHDPRIIVIMLTAFAKIDDAVSAVKEGAFHYLSKPIKTDELVQLVDRALNAHALINSAAGSSPILIEAGTKFIGNCNEMQKVFTIIDRLSKVDTAVMIRGESGTGKELVARAIHYNSVRKDQKFVAINCSAIPETLFESELFGHEKGAFTGADSRKIGKFQFAEGGTLFLDELGDMPLLMQAKLLRVLQDKRFTPVGSNRELEANVRIIAATNRPLEKMIEKGEFREDLFYRLNVIPIFLPSLRDRKNDIENLVQNFIRKFNLQHQKKIVSVAPEAMTCLKRYEWPGNIRELENIVEYAFIWETTNQIHLSSLPEKVLKANGIDLYSLQERMTLTNGLKASEEALKNTSASGAFLNAEGQGLPSVGSDGESLAEGSDNVADTDASYQFLRGETLGSSELDFNRQKELFEKEFIIKALKTFKGRINQTAIHANIPKKTLLRKIEKYGIVAKDYIQG